MASITRPTSGETIGAAAGGSVRDRTLGLLREALFERALGRWPQSAEALDRAATACGQDADASALLGDLCVHIEDMARAFAAYDRAITLRPDRAVFWFNRAAVRRFLGQIAESEADYDRCLALDPDDAQAYLNRSGLREQTPQRNHVEALQARLCAGARGWQAEVQLRYALAKELEDLGEHAASWAQLEAGSRLRRQHLQYDARRDLDTVDWLIDAFPRGAPARRGQSPAEPIFIVGMPRTGSTLVDRILGGHTQVRSAGELLHFGNAVVAAARRVLAEENAQAGGRKELIAASARVDFNALGADYLSRARHAPGARARFTDKLPLNYLYCAHIAAALPQARIVHVVRHPMATCYGVYKVLFDQGYPFSYDLNEIAEYFVAYRRLMAHWQATLPGRIVEVAYEDIVAQPGEACRRVLEALDLPWEEACVQFHLNPAPATTASAAQVRRPIYRTALHQWRNYAAGLEPVRRRLEAAGIDCG